ncbi:ribosomal protein S18 acetylase RimI-like enzyme [Microterricola gilva]|uniref:Ribosomal protein S18 acetylase RimI-like enzyme n=1 Tax=Microterricola gilva TaxID=393267 RepID=A0A4Q8AQC0_9MICO|nr:GNAT family N-acetyltransferase [Microterricola gilva]RZU66255.1 ribosomal protein S18 acetylase RimI-like enzyme [Microterricola gilva]
MFGTGAARITASFTVHTPEEPEWSYRSPNYAQVELGDWPHGSGGRAFATLCDAARAAGIARVNVEVAASDRRAADELSESGLLPGIVFAARDLAAPGAVEPRGLGIRLAGVGDRAALSALAREEAVFQAANTAAGTALDQPPALFDGIADGWLAAEDTVVLIAETAERAEGIVVVQLSVASDAELGLGLPRRFGYIAVLSVTESARGRGVGGALTAHALAWLAAAGTQTVALHYVVDNPTSVPFWTRRGFEPLTITFTCALDPDSGAGAAIAR